LLDSDFVLPAIDEVVLVQEALADAQPKINQPYTAWIAASFRPVHPSLDDEAMQVLVAPGKGRLQGGMQVGDAAVAANE
jgi:hypothetical protein